MQNLLQELIGTLQNDERLVIDGRLVKNKVVELALAMDEGLISLLLGNESIKKHFFKEIGRALVFDKVAFQSFVSNKQFLPDSYTAFKNKIGLTASKEYLTESKEVVLAWPYKDCVLEGGQTKEDQKRKEIFWNETLAPDEIDRLLAPKALSNFKKYDKNGEHKVESISLDDNLIIKGNNLLALHSLKNKYEGKVKLIYIDPPYNTGSDSFGYNDSFNHSTWLTFMKNRLRISQNLLCDEGFIVIQCDDNEQAYLKVLMDEALNMAFLTTICVQMSYVSGEKMAHIDKKPPKIKEYLHIYSKKEGSKIKPQYTTKDVDSEYNKFIIKHDSENIKEWEVVNLNDIFKKEGIKDKEQKEDFMLNNASNIFNRVRNKSTAFKETSGNKKIQRIMTPTGLEKFAWNGREVIFLSDRVITDHEGNLTYSQALGDIWNDIPIVNLYLEGDVTLLNGKKPEFLINRLMDMLSNENDFILDFHLGSGTTCAVAHKMRRRYIGIEQLNYGKNDSIVRLNNVIKGDKSGISKDVDWQGGGSFTYCELTQHNANIIDRIEQVDTTEALKSIFQEIEKTDFITYKIKPETINENIHEFEALTIEEQKQFLIAILDKNQLYVNYSEIEDEDYQISEDDKKLNKQFYGEV